MLLVGSSLSPLFASGTGLLTMSQEMGFSETHRRMSGTNLCEITSPSLQGPSPSVQPEKSGCVSAAPGLKPLPSVRPVVQVPAAPLSALPAGSPQPWPRGF